MISLKKIIAGAISLSMSIISFNIVFAEDKVYYDDNFESMATGVLVNLGITSNSDYPGYLFECSSRSADQNQQSIQVEQDAEKGNVVKMQISKYASADRYLRMNLTNLSDATFNADTIIEFNVKMEAPADGGTAPQLDITDTVGTTLSYTVSNYNVWENVTLVAAADGTLYTIVRDQDENVIDLQLGETIFGVPTRISIPGTYNSTVYIDDLKITDGTYVLSPDVTIEYAKSQIDLTEGNTAVSEAENGSYDVISDFTLPSSIVDVSWKIEQKAKESDSWEESTFLTVNRNSVKVNNVAEVEDYDFRLIGTFSYGGTTNDEIYVLNVKSPNTIMNDYVSLLQLRDKASGTALQPNDDGVYQIAGDLELDKGNEYVTVTWNCYKPEVTIVTDDEGNETEVIEWVDSSIVSSDGVFQAEDYTGELKLTATLTCNGESIQKDFVVASTINAVEEYIDPVIASLTVTSADDATVVYEDAKNIGIVNRDLQFPTSVKVADGDVKIAWEVVSGEEYASIDKNGLLTIMTQDNSAHEVELKAVFTYVKNSNDIISKTDEGYKLNVQFSEDDVNSDDTALDKYKVRFDAANEDQFDIPSSTSSDIELITEGEFGSSIKWTSNAPTIISNTGDFTRPSTNRNVTLTASIMSGAFSETKTFEVTARARSTSSGSGGGGGGGSTSSTGSTSNIDTSGTIAQANPGTITTPQSSQEIVDELIQQREEAENRFTDIGGVSWARDAINGLYDAGIINGKTETTFAPNDNVTRAEFAKMLMGVFGLTSSGFTTSSFYDVPTDAWYFQSVESAYNLGIINGVSAGYFDPDANITRQDMAVMVMRAATVAGQSVTAVEEAITFADDASIADYAKEAVSTLQAAGIINGVSDTEFAPVSNATRAQAAQILYSFL